MRALRALVLLAVLASPSSLEAAWAIDRAWAANSDAASATTITFTYADVVAEGALLVCFIQGAHATNGVVKDMSDSVNGAWTQFGIESPQNSGGLNFAWSGWYYQNSVAATPVVTATFTASVANRGIVCGSYTGIATSSAYDDGSGRGQTNPGTGTDAVTTEPSGVTDAANELAVAAMITQQTGTATAGTGWTERLNTNFAAVSIVHVEDKNVAAPGAVTGTWTISNVGGGSAVSCGHF